MNAVQSRRYEMLVRVRDFGDAHADLFQESSLAQQTFAAVAEAVEQLNAHTVSKLSAAPGMTPKVMARADLQDRLEAISQTARVIAEQTDRNAPSRMTPSRSRIGSSRTSCRRRFSPTSRRPSGASSRRREAGLPGAVSESPTNHR